MSQSVMLSFRVPEEVYVELTQRSKELGLDRSALGRSYIENGLGSEMLDAQIREAVHQLRPIIARVMAEVSSEAINEAAAKLPDRLHDLLANELGVR